MTMTPSEMREAVRELAITNPRMPPARLAAEIGCSVQMARSVRHELLQEGRVERLSGAVPATWPEEEPAAEETEPEDVEVEAAAGEEEEAPPPTDEEETGALEERIRELEAHIADLSIENMRARRMLAAAGA